MKHITESNNGILESIGYCVREFEPDVLLTKRSLDKEYNLPASIS
jgi:hypothetical protein